MITPYAAMKKFLKIFAIIIALLLAAIIVLPFAFKGKIKTAIKSAANENLTAVLDFSDVSLSLIRNFPNLTVTIDDFSLTGTDHFDGVKLIEAQEIRATVDLFSVFGDTIALREIGLNELRVDVRVLPDGRANYDIMKPSEKADTAAAPTTESGGFALQLTKYAINNANISYDDASFPMTLRLEGMNHSGTGDFTQDVFTLATTTHADRFDLVYDGIRYIRDAKTHLDAEIEIDNRTSTYTFKDNSVVLNQLPLEADGYIAMPAEAIEMDLSFRSTGSDLVTLLSMVPAEFASDLAGVKASGRTEFNGFIRGTYDENTMPGFGLNLTVSDGRFSYPDLPESVEKIDIKLRVDAAQGIDSDAMTIDLDRFYMEVARNPIDVSFHLRNPYTDPLVESDIRAKVDFDKLKDVVPLEAGDELTGSLNANLHFKGRVSALDEERYEDFEANGDLVLLDTRFSSESLVDPIDISSLYFKFNPRYAELTNFDARIGASDLSAEGRVNNYLQYALRDELLEGRFNLRSAYLDLNEFTEETTEEQPETPAGEAEEPEMTLSVIRLPENISFVLDAQLDQLHYGDYDISNARGNLVLREGVAHIKGMEMRMLDGTITMSGQYDSQPKQPLIDMDFGMTGIDIQEAVNTFYTIEKMAPIAKSTTGRVSTSFGMRCALDATMTPIEETITGGGKLQTKQIHIEKFEPLNKLAGELGIDRLAKQTINDVNISFKFENGRVGVDPFTVKLEGIETTIDGSMSFSQELDYNVKMTVPTAMLPGNLAGQASGLLNDLNQRFGSNLSVGSKIPVTLKITGTVEKPVVKGNYGDKIQDQVKDVKEQVKEAVKEAVEEKIDEAREAAIAKARAEADKLVADARTRADKLVKEATTAANNARNAAYTEAQKIEDAAKNPLQKVGAKAAADKLRQEADSAHKRAIDEAQKQADAVVKDAQDRADALISAAEKE